MKTLLSGLTATILSCSAFSQVFLKLDYNCNLKPSPFTSVKIFDKRPGEKMMGYVQKGAFNRLEEIKFEGNFYDTLARFFYPGRNVAPVRRDMVLILYRFFLNEQTAMTETGKFNLAFRIFTASEENKYTELMSVDTTYFLTSGWDITKGLLNAVNVHLCEWSDSAKSKAQPSSPADYYTVDDFTYLDSIEKLTIPVYIADKVQEGIYTDYEDFKNNIPDITGVSEVNITGTIIKWVRVENGKKKKIKKMSKEIYALYYNGKLYKTTTQGVYEMKKRDNDFYFVGQTSFSNSFNAAYWGSASLLAGAIAAGTARNTQLFEFKIDYYTGHSIPVSKAGNLPYNYK